MTTFGFPLTSAKIAQNVDGGESVLQCLYKADTREGLDSLRLSKFAEKVAKSSSFVDPKELPPTSDAARYHSLRVFLQIQQWKGNEEGMNPTIVRKGAKPKHAVAEKWDWSAVQLLVHARE